MSRVKKYWFLILALVVVSCGVTVYGASSIFGNLDSIEINVEKLIGFATDNKVRADRLQEELNLEKSKLDNQIVIVENLKKEMAEKESSLDGKNAEIETLKIELSIATTNISMYTNKIEKLENQLAEQGNQLQQAELRVAELEAKVSTAVASFE